jgi:phosphopantothenoylcysteine decarboxylase/phosphopantothenate--cysteine ligase
MLVAPASADFIAQAGPGPGRRTAGLLCLARPLERCPLLLAPAMNREMWAHPATQRNVAQVVADGATLLGPGGRPGLRRGGRRPHAGAAELRDD